MEITFSTLYNLVNSMNSIYQKIQKSNRKHVKIRNYENLNFYNLTTSDRNQPNEESMA